jgi:hypothetical protein
MRLRFRHYSNKKGSMFTHPYFGFIFDANLEQPTLDLYFARHVFVVFLDRTN